MASHEVLSLYTENIDNSLRAIAIYLANLTYDSSEVRRYRNAADEDESALSMLVLQNRLQKDVNLYPQVGVFFVYRPLNDELLYATGSESQIGWTELKKGVHGLIDADADTGRLISNRWHPQQINNIYGLLRMMEIDGVYIGAWIYVDNLRLPANDGESKNNFSAMADMSGTPLTQRGLIEQYGINLTGNYREYYLTGEDEPHLAAGQDSRQGDFTIFMLTPETNITHRFPFVLQIVLLFVGALILISIVNVFFTNRVFLLPMKQLIKAMEQTGRGEENVRLREMTSCKEFTTINRTFNRMSRQIRNLTISVYEESLSRQKAELERLALQVNPHFFLNSLSIIHTLAKSGNCGLIKEMSLYLVRYFRYMFSSGADFVPLEMELKHVENYLHIQLLRFPLRLRYTIEVPDFLRGTPVPPLCIHTFVENAVKYAIPLEGALNLRISAGASGSQGKERLTLTIHDDGDGFPADVLERISRDESIIKEDGEHIGIANVKNRLRQLYRNNACLICENRGGAYVEMSLPLSACHPGEEEV